MTWFLIILTLLLIAFGPLLWLRPTARDRRQAALRSRARRLGVGLDIKALPRIDAAPEERVSAGGLEREVNDLFAVYRWTLGRALTPLSDCRFLRGPLDRDPARPAVRIAVGWYLDPEQAFPPEGWSWLAEPLRAQLQGLPDDVQALALASRSISAYWRESPASTVADVDRLHALMKDFEAALMAVNQPPKTPERLGV